MTDARAVTRTISVGLLLFLVLALTGALFMMSGTVTDMVGSSDSAISFEENETTVTVTLSEDVDASYIYVESKSTQYSGGVNETASTSVLGPKSTTQYLYADGIGGKGTTVVVDISKTDTKGEIKVLRVRDNAEEVMKTYQYNT